MKLFILGSILVASALAFADDSAAYDAATTTCNALKAALLELDQGSITLTNKDSGTEHYSKAASDTACDNGQEYRPAYTAASDKDSCYLGFTCVWAYPGF
jgi:hypothetical protein